MGTVMDKPFQAAMTVMMLVVLLECMGIILYIYDRPWGLVLTVGIAAAMQTLTLILVWYTLKLSFHMGKEIVVQNKATPPENKQN